MTDNTMAKIDRIKRQTLHKKTKDNGLSELFWFALLFLVILSTIYISFKQPCSNCPIE